MPDRPLPPDPGPEPAARRSLRGMLRRLTTTEQQRDAERLQHRATGSGCALCGRVARGEYVQLRGRLRTVVYTPRTNLPVLEAELYDGSGTVTLVWLGRRRIAGIEPGRALTVQGRIAVRDERPVLYNPYYELRPAND